MAIVGYFKNLDEAVKLVQDKLLLAGVIEEIIKEGQLLPRLPFFTINTRSIVYNREKTLPEAAFYDIHEQLPWKAEVEYAAQVTLELKRVAYQAVIDRFIEATYTNPNVYRQQILSELRKGCMFTIEDKIIYGNSSANPKEFDGLANLVDDGMRINQNGALSLANLRRMIDSVKPRPDLLLMPFELQRRMDAAMWEAGISAGSIVRVATDERALGGRMTFFEGIPILPSDFLVAEANDGKTKWSTGTKYYSVYAIRFGQIQQGGVCMATGGETGGIDFFRIITLDELEDYDAAGIRLVAYCALALGSTKSLGQIYGITDSAIVA